MVVLFIAIVVSGVFTQATGAHLLAVILAAVALTCISAAKGPKPRWRWGKKSDDNPDDDW